MLITTGPGTSVPGSQKFKIRVRFGGTSALYNGTYAHSSCLTPTLFSLLTNTLSTMGRPSETSDEKAVASDHVFVAVEDVDTAAELASGEQDVLDPREALRIRFVAPPVSFSVSYICLCRRKIDKHILPLMCSKSSLNIDYNLS